MTELALQISEKSMDSSVNSPGAGFLKGKKKNKSLLHSIKINSRWIRDPNIKK